VDYFTENLVAPGIEAGTSDHYITEAVNCRIMIAVNIVLRVQHHSDVELYVIIIEYLDSVFGIRWEPDSPCREISWGTQTFCFLEVSHSRCDIPMQMFCTNFTRHGSDPHIVISLESVKPNWTSGLNG
jgi:hypothetical protein